MMYFFHVSEKCSIWEINSNYGLDRDYSERGLEMQSAGIHKEHFQASVISAHLMPASRIAASLIATCNLCSSGWGFLVSRKKGT